MYGWALVVVSGLQIIGVLLAGVVSAIDEFSNGNIPDIDLNSLLTVFILAVWPLAYFGFSLTTGIMLLLKKKAGYEMNQAFNILNISYLLIVTLFAIIIMLKTVSQGFSAHDISSISAIYSMVIPLDIILILINALSLKWLKPEKDKNENLSAVEQEK